MIGLNLIVYLISLAISLTLFTVMILYNQEIELIDVGILIMILLMPTVCIVCVIFSVCSILITSSDWFEYIINTIKKHIDKLNSKIFKK